MKKINKKNFNAWLITIVGFVAYATMVFIFYWPQWQASGHLAFNWPDSQANFWAVNQVVGQQSIGHFDILNLPGANILHTRSQNVLNGVILPVTFLPLLLIFTTLTWFLGYFASLLLAPLLAAMSLYLFYRLVDKIFNDQHLANIATILLAVLGPWYYFAVQPLLPNIVICFLALLAFYCLAEKKYLAGTLFFTLALVSRPPEAIWLIPILFLVLYFLKSNWDTKSFVGSILIFLAVIWWALYLNKEVFGGYFLTAYSNLQDKSLPTETKIQTTNIWSWIFPFGFHPYLAFKNFIKYFVVLSWPYILLAILGFWSLYKKSAHLAKKYFLVFLLAAILLILYYGSWDLADPLVKNLNHLSISYVRYWLPLWVMLVPLSAVGIYKLAHYGKNYNSWLAFILALVISSSLAQVYYKKNEGLLAEKKIIDGYYQEWIAIKKIAPEKSIIISERSDKYLYPYYRVVAMQRDQSFWPQIENIIPAVNIYYYTNLSEQDLAPIRAKAFDNNLFFGPAQMVDNSYSLYQVLNK